MRIRIQFKIRIQFWIKGFDDQKLEKKVTAEKKRTSSTSKNEISLLFSSVADPGWLSLI
jgi:hypothetical protein